MALKTRLKNALILLMAKIAGREVSMPNDAKVTRTAVRYVVLYELNGKTYYVER